MATSKGVIKNINTDQHRILADIMHLYNNDEGFELDPTFSKGNYYGDFKWINENGEKESYTIPQPKYKMDVYPLAEDVQKLEIMGNFPLEDETVKSVNIDLPFVISVGPSMGNGNKKSNITSNRFSAFYPVSNLIETYYHFLKEAYRVLKEDGILVWKCQRTITGGKTLNSPEMSWLFAESLGFDCVDAFYLEGKTRLISGKVKHQEHSRSYVSVFYVFKKSHKKKIDYLTAFSEEVKDQILKGIKENNIKEGRKFLSDRKSVQNACHADTKRYEYVDLGLPSGLKWAKCNVGAEKETDYGLYFKWGETSGVSGSPVGKCSDENYSLASYKYCDGPYDTLTKYNTSSLYGENPDNITILESVDDVATQIMGDDWRMPTMDDFIELLDNTTNEWTQVNGVDGYKFTGSNGNSIFIPASGRRSGSWFDRQGRVGYVWSSSLDTSYPLSAWYLYFNSDKVDTNSLYRDHAFVVRGVMKS